MYCMNQEALVMFGERLIYDDGRTMTDTWLPQSHEVSAVGLFGRDVLAARGCNIERWHASTGEWDVLLHGPEAVTYDHVTGDELTGLVAFSVGRSVYFGTTKGEQRVVRLHTRGPASAIAVAPAAPVVAVASGSVVEVFNLASPDAVMSFEGPCDLRALSFSPMGYTVAALTRDDRVVVWSLLTGSIEEVFRLKGRALDVALHDDQPLEMSLLDRFGGRQCVKADAPAMSRDESSGSARAAEPGCVEVGAF